MTRFKATAISMAALAGIALCAAPLQSASAFTLNSTALTSKATPPADKAYWRHGGGWHGGWHGGGWVPGAIIGGLAAGALLGGGYYGYYGPGYGYYGPGPYYGDCWYDHWGRRVCS